MPSIFNDILKRIQKRIEQTVYSKYTLEDKKAINKPADFNHLSNENVFLGTLPEMHNSRIVFSGNNNILFCEPGVILSDCNIVFNADNSLIYLSTNKHQYRLSISINNDSVCYVGKNNYFNGVLHVILSEHKHFFVGNDCLFSFDVWARNADPHLIYNEITGERINQTRSIYVGDHVWVGQSVMILKGTKIDSGSIIGAMSVVSGTIDHNSIWAGNPIRKLKDFIFWDGSCVHKWKQNDTDRSKFYAMITNDQTTTELDHNIFQYDKDEVVPYESIDNAFDGDDPKRKLEYINQLNENVNKNRFIH